MIRLLSNTTGQSFYATPYEARKFLATFTNYLIEFKLQATSETFYFIANVVTDNERLTKVAIDTSVNDAVNGNIKLSESGLYTYKIWGQNSAINLDPEDASVVGEVERGAMQIIGEDAWTLPTISIPNNVVYYE